MPFSLTQLQTLVRLTAERNFTRTAEGLNLTQPAVTQQIRALSDHFGVTLVDVVGRRVVPTAAGTYLAQRAGELLMGVASLEHEMREFAAVRSGALAVGASLTVGSFVLPAVLQRFHALHPDVVVAVQLANTSAIADAVAGGEVALGLVEGPVEGARVELTPFGTDELVLAVPPRHRFARRRAVAPAELLHETLVAREPGSGTREVFDRALALTGLALPAAIVLPSGEAITQAVIAGIGVAIVSEIAVADALASGRLAVCRVRELDLRRNFSLARARGRTLSPAAESFAQLVLKGRA